MGYSVSVVKATKIKWDTDGVSIDDLPKEVNIPGNILVDDIADYLSDAYGWCVESFSVESKVARDMGYEDFYDLAIYANDAWKGSYTAKEVAVNAYCYLSNLNWSVEHQVVGAGMKELIALLKQDDSEDAKYWLWRIECAMNSPVSQG